VNRVVEERGVGPYTWDDFIELPEGDRRELIDGHLVEVEVPSYVHECVVAVLIELLGAWRRKHARGRIAASGAKVRISGIRGLMPDVQLLGAPRSGRPELAVEVISPSSRRYDRITKLEYYASIGTPEYWIVDPELRTVERLVLRRGHYLIADSLAGGAVFRPSSFDGLEIPLAELWEAAAEGAAFDAAEDVRRTKKRAAKKRR
jgi:Uma2 family endonuclease